MTAEQTFAPPQVGEMFVCTWGWEQTNVDFYEVVGIGPTRVWGGPSVMVRHVASRFEPHGETGEYSATAVPGQYTERPVPGQHTTGPCQREWKADGQTVSIFLAQGHYARRWDGRPVYGNHNN